MPGYSLADKALSEKVFDLFGIDKGHINSHYYGQKFSSRFEAFFLFRITPLFSYGRKRW